MFWIVHINSRCPCFIHVYDLSIIWCNHDMFGRSSRADSDYYMNLPLPDGIVVIYVILRSGRIFGIEPCRNTSTHISTAKPSTDSPSTEWDRLHCVYNQVHFLITLKWNRGWVCRTHSQPWLCKTQPSIWMCDVCCSCSPWSGDRYTSSRQSWCVCLPCVVTIIDKTEFKMLESKWGCLVFTRFFVRLWLSWCE